MTDDIVKEVIHDKLKTIEWLKNKLEQQQKQLTEMREALSELNDGELSYQGFALVVEEALATNDGEK
jgi:hypothetical protein